MLAGFFLEGKGRTRTHLCGEIDERESAVGCAVGVQVVRIVRVARAKLAIRLRHRSARCICELVGWVLSKLMWRVTAARVGRVHHAQYQRREQIEGARDEGHLHGPRRSGRVPEVVCRARESIAIDQAEDERVHPNERELDKDVTVKAPRA